MWWSLLPAVCAAAAWGAIRHHEAALRARVVLGDYGPAPSFALTDAQGRPASSADLQGRIWVADFIFTRCAGQCPMMSGRMQALQEAFVGHPDVQLVSFTVDPGHDRPDVLAAYAEQYAARQGRWRFLTGEPAAMERLAHDGFRLAFAAEPGSVSEPITHSARLVLVDQAGRIRGYFDTADPDAQDRLEAAIRQLLPAR